tara:strand:- start:407 stop:1270 length:864 start_codon:yes stop_codon:yes gene_type:complete
MNLNHTNTTFIIVTYKSEFIIHECLKTLPNDYNKIIIENSGNIKLKENLESKYDNLQVFISDNLGMGASNNVGIKKCNTDFAFVINPDIKFKENTLEELVKAVSLIDNFAILSPISSDPKFPNYVSSKKSFLTENIISVDRIDGYSMLINKKRFKDNQYFDINFFMYLENDDLCLKKKKENENLYIIKKSIIEHLGGKSSDIIFKEEIELSRNWHWMWSKFYFNKKHYGLLFALRMSLGNFITSFLKYFFYLIIFNNIKKNNYKMRLSGIFNAVIGKTSWYRPNIKY